MQSVADFFVPHILRKQRTVPGVTPRLYNILRLVAAGWCTSKQVYYTVQRTKIAGKGWNDVYNILDDLDKLGLINYRKGAVIPYRGKALGIISCTSMGYAFISMITERCEKMAKHPPTFEEMKGVNKTTEG